MRNTLRNVVQYVCMFGWVAVTLAFIVSNGGKDSGSSIDGTEHSANSRQSSEAITGDPDSLDTHVVERSYVKVDDSLFVCKGDVSLHVSEVGVITFDCNRANHGLQRIITNPSELFISQTLGKQKVAGK